MVFGCNGIDFMFTLSHFSRHLSIIQEVVRGGAGGEFFGHLACTVKWWVYMWGREWGRGTGLISGVANIQNIYFAGQVAHGLKYIGGVGESLTSDIAE